MTSASRRADSARPASRTLDTAGFGLILLSTLVTSSQAIGVKYGLEGFTPFNLIATRSVLAVLLLMALAWRMRLPFPRSRGAWLGGIVLGIFQVGVPGCIFWWALQYAPVGRATLLTSTQPFLMVIAAHFLLQGEKLNGRKLAGLAVGFAGVILVVLGRGGDLGSGGLLVDGAILLAASMWAGSQILVKFIGHLWHNLSLLTVQMSAAAVVTLIAVALFEPNRTANLTPESVGGLVYLVTIGTVGMFMLMFYTIQRYEVSIVSSFIFLQPVVAVVLGWLLLGEQLTSTLVLSMALVALGLVLVNWNGRARRKAVA